jgi:hypothetical protein
LVIVCVSPGPSFVGRVNGQLWFMRACVSHREPSAATTSIGNAHPAVPIFAGRDDVFFNV